MRYNKYMRILLVVTNADVGGAQKRIIDLAESYQAAGHTVTVASGPSGDHLPAALAAHDIPYQRFQYLSRANPFKILAYIFELWRFLGQEDFDVVHLNSSSALAGALACKVRRQKPRVVFTFRGLSILAPGYKTSQLKKRFYEYAYKTFLPLVDVGVFQCDANREVAHQIGLHTKEEAVIQDGINPVGINFLPRDVARQELESIVDVDLTDKKIIGSIGRLAYAKNYGFLIQQMRKLAQHRQDVVCIIIGAGPQRESLATEIHRLGLENSVFLVGQQEDAAKFLRGFDVFTLPSRYEGLSMTLTEALHAGVPLLVSDVGCSGSIVNDDRLVFVPGNALDFISKLRSLLEIEDTEKLSKQLVMQAESLTLGRSVEQYLEVYERAGEAEEQSHEVLLESGEETSAVIASDETEVPEIETESVGPKSVLHLITGLESGGGAETFLSRIIPQLDEDTDVHHVVCSLLPPGAVGDQLRTAGVEVRSLDQRSKFDPRLITRYRRLIKELQPDMQINYLIHADLLGRIFGKLFGAKKIVSFIRNNHQDWTDKLVEKMTIRLVDCLLTNSQAVMDYYAANYQIPDCTSVIPNGVPLPEDIEKTSHEDDSFVIITVARLHPVKSLQTLVEAAAISKEDIPNLEVLFVGEGQEETRLKQLATKLGVGKHAFFLGKRDDVPDILAASDVFVLPSHREGMSNALLEAMAMGLPPVVSNIPENTELVTDGENGLVFDLGDAESLAAKLRKLFTDSQLREDYGRNSRQRIEDQYAIEATRKNLQEFIADQI